MTENYSVTSRSFSAGFISPTRETLEKFSREKEKNFPDAKFVWSVGCTRFHMFRLFTPEKKVVKASAAFLCDCLFDVWLNGKLIVTDTKHLELTDITRSLVEGENNLHIRAYQSKSYDSFTSAFTGGIRLEYDDGSASEILTDDSFKQIQLVTFWETKEPESFETAAKGKVTTLNVSDLHPAAIRRSFYFIRRFEVGDDLVSATLSSTALGCHEPYLNGKRISDAFFEPFCMNFRHEYSTLDITPFVKRGINTLGFILGNGSYNCRSWGSLYWKVPELMAELTLKYKDGRVEKIFTDESWHCIESPVVENDIQYGERYDARLEIPDWCENSFDLTKAYPVASRKCETELIEKSYPPIRKMKEHKLSEYRMVDGCPLYDVGVCVAGRASIRLKNLRRGQKLLLRYCERLTDGRPENGAYVTVFYQNDCDKGGRSEGFLRNIDVYTAKGEGEEFYECRFAYTGFRYIMVEGLDSIDQIVSLTAFELYNDLKLTGEISTGDADIMKIYSAARRSWLNNLSNGPTDCPTREKNYWNGDSELFVHAANFVTDNSEFLARWTDNGIKTHAGPYAWEDETYEIPYALYRFYGDVGILRARYDEMLKLVEKRQEFSGMILPVKGISHQYNDWLSPGGVTPNTEFFGGCWYIHMLKRVSEIASILGDSERSSELSEKAEIAVRAFNERHLLENDYDAKCQCGIVLPIAFDIAPVEKRQALADRLSEYVKEADYHTTTGFIGARFLFEVLADYGHADDAYRILKNPTAPSLLGMLSSGATAITESWYGEADPDKSLSMSHFSLGSVLGWFFEYLGGIRVNESTPGLYRIALRPVMIPELGEFSASYDTGHGVIRTHWRYVDGKPEFWYETSGDIEIVS